MELKMAEHVEEKMEERMEKRSFRAPSPSLSCVLSQCDRIQYSRIGFQIGVVDRT